MQLIKETCSCKSTIYCLSDVKEYKLRMKLLSMLIPREYRCIRKLGRACAPCSVAMLAALHSRYTEDICIMIASTFNTACLLKLNPFLSTNNGLYLDGINCQCQCKAAQRVSYLAFN